MASTVAALYRRTLKSHSHSLEQWVAVTEGSLAHPSPIPPENGNRRDSCFTQDRG